MADVLSNEPRPSWRWALPLAVVVLAATVLAVVRSGDSSGRRPPAGPAAPTASPTASPLPSPVSAGGACRFEVLQPLIDAAPVPPRTGLRILVGDRDLRLLDVDAGQVRVLTARPDRRSFTALTRTATGVLAVLGDRCAAEGPGNVVAAVDPVDGAVSRQQSGDAVLPGEPPTVLDYDETGTTVVRDFGGTSATRTTLGLYARTRAGFFASISGSGDAPPELGIGSPGNPRLARTFGAGIVVAASPEKLFWLAGDCPGVHCLLTWTTVDGTNTAQAIDTYGWGGEVSPDGTKMAFRKQRASGRLGPHPGPPGDITVLDMSHGGAPLVVLPGLVLPTKAGFTLTWSPDSQWLVIGADPGTGPAVLIWRAGMARPALLPMPATGGGTTGPPALLVLPPGR